jgi:hypothetical protein
MAYRKTHRKNRSHSHKKRRNTKNNINKTVDTTISVANKTVSVAKSTSKKYMPKVKTGLENIGNKVIKTGTESIPFLQGMTRNFFGLFTRNKTKKNRKH